MIEELAAEIIKLQQVHNGLKTITDTENCTIISGPLLFEASTDNYGTLTECFEIDLNIPSEYPKILPFVRETGGKIDGDYEHLNQDRTLCLAIPIEERRLFCKQPSLLGFVNNLVIPYLFGYQYWKKNGTHPFDEAEHGGLGIIEYYVDVLGLSSKIDALAVVSFLVEHGYRGHHSCPCGSGKKIRKCHGKILRDLHERHTQHTLMADFFSILDVCIYKIKSDDLHIPLPLMRQVFRILEKYKLPS